ncbi:MAG: heavy metal translocating P-type ATPase [Aestuariivita sp.]|nr:heavy metal translocating P-type ATPase [Aestuariivita sp.]MCY4346850.1 heavy metal translocating P-type ATPase [Aestuariivita sp.]
MSTQTSPPTIGAPDQSTVSSRSQRAVDDTTPLVIALPGIHCQNCIAAVEKALEQHSKVVSARVNLTLKRVFIEAVPSVSATELMSVLNTAGFEAHELGPTISEVSQEDKAGRDLLMRVAVAAFATMNVMMLSISVWSGAENATRDLFHWISAAITLPAIVYSAQPFFRNAWSSVKARRMNMDVPIVFAILLALMTSLWETMLSGHHAYFDAAMALTFFLLVGRYLDHRTRIAARSAAKELSAMEVTRAWRLEDGKPVAVAAESLVVGDLIWIKPGERVAVDGIVTQGQSEIDRSLLTGETIPAPVTENETISAGEVNLTGLLTVRATAVGEDTSLRRIAALVAVAESGRSNYHSLADRAAKLYAPGVHILALMSFFGWMLYSADVRVSLNIAAAVLIITCPCALGLAVPAVTTAASGRLFRRGLLIKSATALERLSTVDKVVFDKTGTLTLGQPEVTNVNAFNSEELGVALALAQGSEHPLSQALARAATKARIEPIAVTDIKEVPGFGTEGNWEGRRVRLGRGTWVGGEGLSETSTWLAIGDDKPQAFRFVDTLRPQVKDVIATLQSKKLEVFVVSGDAQPTVSAFAERLKIKHWLADASPEDKVKFIDELTAQGAKVLMVGDGLNDTVALSSAHVSFSPATALDAARVASDVVLLNNDLAMIPEAIDVSKSAVARIRENFQIATIYNIFAVPLAVAGFATPLIAALAMSTSSITVSLNALRLR